MKEYNRICLIMASAAISTGCAFSAKNYSGGLEWSEIALVKTHYEFIPYVNFENVIIYKVISSRVNQCKNVRLPLKAEPCPEEVKIDGTHYDVLKLLPGKYSLDLRCEFEGSYGYPIFEYEFRAGYTYILQCERFSKDGKMLVRGKIKSERPTE